MTSTIFNQFAGKIALLPIRAIKFNLPLATPAVSTQVKAGIVGDGSIVLTDPAYSSGVQEGIYTVKITDALTQEFTITKPDGTTDTGSADIPYVGEVNFELTSGEIDFALNDTFYILVSKGDYLLMYNVEEESSFTIDAKTRTNDKGQSVTLGYMLNGTIYFPYNLFHQNGLIDLFESDLAKDYEMSILLGNAKTSVPAFFTEPKFINSTDGMIITIPIGIVRHSFNIEQIQFRSRVKIGIGGFLKNLSTDNIIFTGGTNE
jgi:hypothetical protein